jgi:hypothetical protein
MERANLDLPTMPPASSSVVAAVSGDHLITAGETDPTKAGPERVGEN